ncbi:biotin carboxylase N-terminal domain-containing protein [Enterovirga rhinocerotis]|uniref:3-methylcrotonyl-CoA carboxylase alpha subunit n=1 Tax=Enterovirga rhinocerotis TaxID=1339210 RepID=A0A4R7BWX7_9HYPH|nr:biotin carboxylase N-terminal domain-containing protein [Enterovirga rhinocerotis]TDR90420.1 3-methylcrotonyl-CoA carboxylase alpha subunit [Enterovirga rhinocerotis]
MILSAAPRPIRTLLVANRGEIACRVMRTARRLGLRTIAVYSDADRNALHVRSADEAHRLGPAAASASYLDIEAVIGAAKAAGADAIHPGYGFLSENAAFVRRCEEEGIAFVGPTSAAVAAMGSKIEAKRIAIEAGVPTVPGYLGDDQSPGHLRAEADRIGYPVLIKASAGGGGRGMRLVEAGEDFEAALSSAKAEARSAFGDDAVLLEKFVADPRHLEVQIIGDGHGNLLHVFERDCSVQRNNQKVIEEAPAPNLPESVRATLFEAALKLGRAIGYTSAGTIEFILQAGGEEPYFLEMNTRLQVEHPVTEAITGIDLVEWQLRVAAGLPLPLRQDEIVARGHAIEVRLAAERPDRGFQPSVGTFTEVSAPAGLRFDTGIESGSEVGLHYDSMVAKLIAHGSDRTSAVERLHRGLAALVLLGAATNQAFLRDCLAEPDFAEGRATTRFLGRAFPEGWQPAAADLARVRAAAAAAAITAPAGAGIWTQPSGFRVMARRRPARVWTDVVDEYGRAAIRLERRDEGLSAEIDGVTVDLDGPGEAGPGTAAEVAPAPEGGWRVLATRAGLSIDAIATLSVETPRVADDAGATGRNLVAPLPGLVSDIRVQVGDRVSRGETGLQMEAMKLIHTLAFATDGTVTAIRCAVGDIVASGATLVEIDAAEEV